MVACRQRPTCLSWMWFATPVLSRFKLCRHRVSVRETSKVSRGLPERSRLSTQRPGPKHFGAERAQLIVGEDELGKFCVLRKGAAVDELDLIPRQVDFRHLLVVFEGVDVDVADALVRQIDLFAFARVPEVREDILGQRQPSHHNPSFMYPERRLRASRSIDGKENTKTCLRQRDPTSRAAAVARAMSRVEEARDVVIVGGGHNGLVAAAYLAAAGLKVTVAERRPIVGGAAITEEFHPGFRNSVAAYAVSLLNPSIARDLDLARHGLRIVERPLSNFLPLPDGRYLKAGPGRTKAEVAKFSARDAERLCAYESRLERMTDVLRACALGRRQMLRPAGDLRRASSNFSRRRVPPIGCVRSGSRVSATSSKSSPVRPATSSTNGSRASRSKPFSASTASSEPTRSPYAAGTAYVLLHHCFGETNGRKGAWGHAVGGMGMITQAMARACEARGVEIRTGASVAEIAIRDGRAVGVLTDKGERLVARAVVSVSIRN